MKELASKYDHLNVEKDIYKTWCDEGYFKAVSCILDMHGIRLYRISLPVING